MKATDSEETAVAVRRSPIAGKGVYATRPVPAGAVLGALRRPLVRYARVPKKGEPGYGHWIQVKRGWWLSLDETPFYFLNHSCDPNTRVLFRGTGIRFVSRRRLREGDELTIDYGSVAYADDPYAITCRCGTGRCRATVRGRRR